MISQTKGDIDILPYKKAASTVFAKNDVVTTDASGFLVRAVAGTTKAALVGLIDRDVAATDADYAQNTMCNVTVLRGPDKEFTGDVEAGTLTQALTNTAMDLNDHNGVNAGAAVIGHVTLLRLISTTLGVFKFSA